MGISLDDAALLKTKLDEQAGTLFMAIADKAGLQITTKNGANLVENEDISDETQLKRHQEAAEDELQIITIRQKRTWETLDLSRELFEVLMTAYEVFAPFWKCVFTFGVKSQENEFEFPGLNKRRNYIVTNGKIKYTHEFSYVMRRVEDNGRGPDNGNWSIRQTAVYHNLGEDKTNEKSTFLMVAPSPRSELLYNQYLQQSTTESHRISVWNIHRIIIADGVKGWGDYMASLENSLIARSDQIVMTPVGIATETLAGLADYIINFEDRQNLKILEDSIMDLLIILPTMVKTIKDIRRQCEAYCKRRKERPAVSIEEVAELESILDELDEYANDMTSHLERATSLNQKAKSTTQLLSDLLNYEEAVAMKALTLKARDENNSIKILTVITLVYLPFTIVANVFSTEFVKATDKNHMTLAKNFWLLFAIAVPLTAFTLILWRSFVYFNRSPGKKANAVEHKRRSWRAAISWKKQKSKDVESGLATSQRASPPNSGIGTSTSVASTGKCE